jgi:hypothetical protein
MTTFFNFPRASIRQTQWTAIRSTKETAATNSGKSNKRRAGGAEPVERGLHPIASAQLGRKVGQVLKIADSHFSCSVAWAPMNI